MSIEFSWTNTFAFLAHNINKWGVKYNISLKQKWIDLSFHKSRGVRSTFLLVNSRPFDLRADFWHHKMCSLAESQTTEGLVNNFLFKAPKFNENKRFIARLTNPCTAMCWIYSTLSNKHGPTFIVFTKFSPHHKKILPPRLFFSQKLPSHHVYSILHVY